METGESLGERLYPNYLHMLSIFCVKPDCVNGKTDLNHFVPMNVLQEMLTICKNNKLPLMLIHSFPECF